MAKKLKCFLVRISTGDAQELTVIDGLGFTVGRSLDATLAFASPQISRTHLHVKAKNDRVWIEDPGSANGTFVGDERITSGKFFEIGPKDVIRLGQSDICLSINLINKVFDVNLLKKTDVEERTQALALVDAAKAEAERLSLLGQSDYNRLLTESRQAVEKIKQDAKQEAQKMLETAEFQASQIKDEAQTEAGRKLAENERQARHAVERIHQEAEATQAAAQALYEGKIKEAEAAVSEILGQAQAQTKLKELEFEEEIKQREKSHEEAFQSEAKERRRNLTDLIEKNLKEAEQNTHVIIAKAGAEGERLIAAAKEKVKTLLDEADANIGLQQKQANEEAEMLIFRAKERSVVDRREQIESAKREIEKIKNESADEIKTLTETVESYRSTLKTVTDEIQNKMHTLRQLEVDHEARIQKMVKDAETEIREQREKGLADLKLHEENQNRTLETRRRKLEDEWTLQKQLLESDVKTKQEKADLEITKHRTEVESELKAMRSQIEAEVTEKRRELAELIEEQGGKLKHLTDDVTKNRHELSELLANKSNIGLELSTLMSELKRREKESMRIGEEIERMQQKEEQLRQEAKAVEAKLRRSTEKLADSQARLADLEKKRLDVESNEARQLAEGKKRIEEELKAFRVEQDEQQKKMQDDHMLELADLRRSLFDKLELQKDEFAKEVILQIEKPLYEHIDYKGWSNLRAKVEDLIKELITQKLANETTHHNIQSFNADMKVQSKRRQEKFSWVVTGLTLGAALLVLGQFVYEQVNKVSDPMRAAAEQKAEERAQDLARRKFSPAQTDELRNKYVDRVLYTRNFTVQYLDPEFQKIWVGKATRYFLRNWQLTEEKTVEAISIVNALVQELEQKKSAIHPDAIEEGLGHMRELEDSALLKLQETLGSEVRREAFAKIEVKHFEKFRAEKVERQPSAAVPPSGEGHEVPTNEPSAVESPAPAFPPTAQKDDLSHQSSTIKSSVRKSKKKKHKVSEPESEADTDIFDMPDE